MLQSLNALAGKISPSSPTDSNANKVHMHNNNNVVHHHHPYSKQQTQPSPASHSSNNSDQKENTSYRRNVLVGCHRKHRGETVKIRVKQYECNPG
ncbi:CUGBP Elav-like family member 1 isoform X1 [Vespula maculifrons]|uniref:CUGBP Elav-like family member 1 isoform X1 n=1 Tax=Vespula maculifrons TaxID=7453 RepID=A0ABD2ARK3_VESMC